MERVQFQQEQMLSELKDLEKKGLFSQVEIKQIMKKRTAFETALVRRVARKGDFLRYAAYEMALEALRRKRITRMKLPPAPPTISDYAMVRRQFYIFERALKKFKEDVGLWIQYLELAKRENARSLVGRISALALQLHPNVPALYIFAASHEWRHLSPSAARTLLLRGIRLNPESVELWREYVKMELGFIESLRRRWKVLGLEQEGSKHTPEVVEQDTTTMEVDMTSLIDPEAVVPEVHGAETIEEDGEASRREIMHGAIVRTVIDSAVEALPTLSLFEALQDLLAIYPCPAPLRRGLLEHLHQRLQSNVSTLSDAGAANLYCTRHLTADLKGVELVDAIQHANEDFMECMKSSARDTAKGKQKLSKDSPTEELGKAYVAFVEKWIASAIDENLKLYLTSSLRALCSTSSIPCLLAADLHIAQKQASNQPTKLLKLARNYTSKAAHSPQVWLARLDVEAALASREVYQATWKVAHSTISTGHLNQHDENLREALWTHTLDHSPGLSVAEQKKMTEDLLLEALQYPSLVHLQEELHMRVVRLICVDPGASQIDILSKKIKQDLQRLAQKCLPSAQVWSLAFDQCTQLDAKENRTDGKMRDVLQFIYEKWSTKSTLDHADAAIAWARWLVAHGEGSEAANCTARASSMLSGDAKAAFEKRWRDVLDTNEEEGENQSEDDENVSDLKISS